MRAFGGAFGGHVRHPLFLCLTRTQNPSLPHAQARNLTWRDLSEQQLQSIRHPHPKKGLTGRDLLASFTGTSDHASSPRSAIALDLYVHTLQQGEEMKLADDKLSTMFSIVKEVHRRSVAEVGGAPIQACMQALACMHTHVWLSHAAVMHGACITASDTRPRPDAQD